MVVALTATIVVLILLLAGFTSYNISRKQARDARYMSVIAGGAIRAGDSGRDRQMAKQRADNIARKLKEAGAAEAARKKDSLTIRDMMEQAGFDAPVSRYWIFSALFAVVVLFLCKAMTSWPPIVLLFVGITALLGMPKVFLKWKAGRRQKKFLEEFADALDASVRLLQAGMPISEAVAMVAREFEGPLREEMMRIYENQKIGTPLGAAAHEMAQRVPLPEAHMFATALQIQSETGSSLSEVLSNLSAVIRARFRLKRKIRALSSEAKASAGIIAALPVLVTLGLYAVNEEYISLLFDTRTGNILLGGAIFWMSCGILIMRQMINFKV